MQQISDGSPANASITISFKHGRRVFFSYSKKEKGKLRRFLNIYYMTIAIEILILISSGILITISMVSFSLLYLFFHDFSIVVSPQIYCYTPESSSLQVFQVFLAGFLWAGPPFWAAAMIYFRYDKWKTIYPKINFFIITLFKKIKKITIRKIKNKTFEINCFGNVFLQYSTSGEFKKYLETIKIRPVEYYNKGWRAVFSFKKNPKKGFLKVEYL